MMRDTQTQNWSGFPASAARTGMALLGTRALVWVSDHSAFRFGPEGAVGFTGGTFMRADFQEPLPRRV